MKKVIFQLSFYFLVLLPALGFSQETNQDWLEKGFQAFNEGNYQEALQSFLTIKNFDDNADLNYNKGSCYLQLGDKARALFYYKKAHELNPWDKDVKQELTTILETMPNRSLVSEPFYHILRKIFFWNRFFSFKSTIIIWMSLWNILWLVLLLQLLFKKEVVVFRFIFILLCLQSIPLGMHLWRYLHPQAIVITENAQIHPNYLQENLVLHNLSSGSEVTILDKETFSDQKVWYQISFDKNKKGWISGNDLGVL